MEDYLQPTEFLDCDHESVREYAERNTAGAVNDIERAVKLYYAVRDGFQYDPYVLDLRRDALKATIAALKAKKLSVPPPNGGGVASGKFVARVPKTVHAQLAIRARSEGVSLNTLVLTFIAQGLGGTATAARAKRAG